MSPGLPIAAPKSSFDLRELESGCLQGKSRQGQTSALPGSPKHAADFMVPAMGQVL